MSNPTATGSPQIPLFEFEARRVSFLRLDDAIQMPLVECEPVQLSLGMATPRTGSQTQGKITEDKYRRHMLLLKAAACTPSGTKAEFFKLFERDSQGDTRAEVLDYYLRTFVKKGQLKAKLPNRLEGSEGQVIDDFCRWNGMVQHHRP